MAAFKRLLSQNGNSCFSNPPPPHHLVSLLRRRFSNEPQPSPPPEPNPNPNGNIRRSITIEPVSYASKPKPPPPEQLPPERQQTSLRDASGEQTSTRNASDSVEPETLMWTRDEMRYIKDAPAIAPISYASRVAPLPEDRGNVGEGEVRNEELERERERRMQEDRLMEVMSFGSRVVQEPDRRMEVMRFGSRVVQEPEENLPFPKLIRAKSTDQNSKKKSKAVYDLKEAIRLVKADGRKTFDETLEAHVKLTLRRTDLKLNSNVRLPHGFGKTNRVAVFAEGAAADEAREAGADIVGGQELVESIRTGDVKVDFDKCIATPSMMGIVKKISRNLKQLTPDPKKGTVTTDVPRAVKEAKVESVHFKKDKSAIVHVGLGKLSFPEDNLRENVGAFVNALLLAKPVGLKKSSKFGGYINSFHICSTMGRGSYPVTIQSLSMAADNINRLQVQ